MNLKYWPNKIATTSDDNFEIIFSDDQNILTLIWENGSWKSTILESILEKKLDLEEWLVIAYSSWLNESFTSVLKPYIDKNKSLTINGDIEVESSNRLLNWFYFTKEWAALLIFLAYSLKKKWLVSTFFWDEKQAYLIPKDSDFFIQLDIEIGKTYIKTLEKSEWEHKSLLTSDFHIKLEKLMNNLRLGTLWNWQKKGKDWSISEKRQYEFEKDGKFTSMVLFSEDVKDIFGTDKDKILNFLWLLTNKNYFLNPQDVKLYFDKGLSLNSLSDGEFQLLIVYALLDIFDSWDTVFLFDEVDSHLHYKNLNILWENLRSIQWKIITTTHIPDSILNNDIAQIRLVREWIIDKDNTPNSLLNRLENISDKNVYEKKVASNIEYICLIDDCTDWFIFLEFAKIKKWTLYDTKIESIHPVKCNSGFKWQPNEIFWWKKLNWIDDFIAKNSNFKTKKIFSICDKDECPIAQIGEDMKFKEYHNGKNSKVQQFWGTWNIYYLSWKRREIENYFLSYTLLSEVWLLEQVNNELGWSQKIQSWNPWDNNWVRDFQAKEIVQMFAQKDLNWNMVWKEYDDLKQIIEKIPANEISDDIEKMYNFIISKI